MEGKVGLSTIYKSNRHKDGVKFFELCTDDGFILNSEIYSGTKCNDPESFG